MNFWRDSDVSEIRRRRYAKKAREKANGATRYPAYAGLEVQQEVLTDRLTLAEFG